VTRPSSRARSARLAGRLRELRTAHGIRREDLAAAAGVALTTVSGLEKGAGLRVKASTLVRVAWALGLPVSEVWPGFAARPPRPGLIQRAQRVAAREAREVATRRGQAAELADR
jgi:transcriptional regulator with XRE-family HTH domain